jgi:hypothetical protein
MTSALTHLLGLRRHGLRNRLRHHGPSWWLAVGTSAAMLLLLWVGLGHLAAPSLVVPPVDIATPRGLTEEALPAGAGALEASFWLTALIAAILNFRVLELLFRRADIRALENYPVPLTALFFDRLLLGFGEALGAGALCALFFLPLVWHGTALAAGLSAALLVGGLMTTVALAFAVFLVSGASLARATAPERSDGPRRPSGDLYGGSGQVFLYAPGVALAFSIVAILFLKLVLGEILRHEAVSRIAEVGLGVVAALVVISVFLAYRDFTATFPAMAARFREADIIGFDVDLPYQRSAFTRPTRLEALVPGAARYLYRVHVLQYGRRYMMGRYLYGLGWAGAGWALWSLSEAAFPAWVVATLPAIALALLANPWRRLASYHGHAITGLALAITSHEDNAARSLFTAREGLLLAGPYVALVLAIRGGVHGAWESAAVIAAVSLFAPLALNAIMGWMMRSYGPRPIFDSLVPIVVTLAIAATASVSLLAALVSTFVLTLTHWILWTRTHDLHAVPR